MLRLLIVDDEHAICFALSDYFTRQGFQVDCAYQVTEAQEFLRQSCYTALIADLRMTGTESLDGLEVVKFAHARCPQTSILVLTAYGSPEIEARVRKNGAHAFLLKPKPLPDLAQIVYGLVGNSSSRKHGWAQEP